MEVYGKYFYGNRISDYGIRNGYVDYGTLAKGFDAVMCNEIMRKTGWENWEQLSGDVDNSEKIRELWGRIEELNDVLDALSDCGTETGKKEIGQKIVHLQNKIDELELEESSGKIYQYFIVSESGAELLQEIGEIVFYNYDLDMFVWGVTHYGTSWDYVLTNIKIIEREES